jgi:hypothetical protein
MPVQGEPTQRTAEELFADYWNLVGQLGSRLDPADRALLAKLLAVQSELLDLAGAPAPRRGRLELVR